MDMFVTTKIPRRSVTMEQLPCEILKQILSYLTLESLSMVWDVNIRMRNVLGYSGASFFKNITLGNIVDLVNTYGQSPLAEFLVTLPQINPNYEVCGQNMLQLSSHQGRPEFVKVLLKHPDLNVNKADKFGKTALHKAAEEGHKITTELLLSHPDIDINAQDNIGQTALHIAVGEDMIDIVHLLLEKDNIDINIRDNFGISVLNVVSKLDCHPIIDLLLVNPNLHKDMQSTPRRTCPHLAYWAGNEACGFGKGFFMYCICHVK